MLAGDLAQRPAGGGGLLHDGGGLVVADVRVERGGDGEGRLGEAGADLEVGLEAVDALLGQQREADDSRWSEWSRFRAISGIITLSSRWPCMPPT